jgi:SAM-dependent methyltransferase
MHDPVNYYAQCYDSQLKGEEILTIPDESLIRAFRRLGIRADSGDEVLDFGCGEGRNAMFLQSQGDSVFGVDVSQPAVDMTRKRLGGKFDGEKIDSGAALPYADKKFSLILAWDVCHWLGSRNSFHATLSEFKRTLKSGGFLIISMPTEKSYYHFKSVEVGESEYKITSNDRKDFVAYAPNRSTLSLMFASLGFEEKLVLYYAYGDTMSDNDLVTPFSQYAFVLQTVN